MTDRLERLLADRALDRLGRLVGLKGWEKRERAKVVSPAGRMGGGEASRVGEPFEQSKARRTSFSEPFCEPAFLAALSRAIADFMPCWRWTARVGSGQGWAKAEERQEQGGGKSSKTRSASRFFTEASRQGRTLPPPIVLIWN